MADLQALRVELDAGHPVTGAYSPNNATAANEINAVNRTLDRARMSASEVLNSADVTEFNGLNANDEQKLWRLLAIGELNPFGIEATIISGLFGSGSSTVSNFGQSRRDEVSRASELGLSRVRSGTVAQARAL